MTLSEFIDRLEELRADYGDITVLQYNLISRMWANPQAAVQDWFDFQSYDDELPCGVKPPDGPFVELS